MNIFFLDDSEERIEVAIKHFGDDDLFIERTASEAIDTLDRIGDWGLVMLDHDLGGEVFVDSGREDCGMEVVRWIVRHRPNIERIVVHSWNSPAAEGMVETLRVAGYHVAYKPFSAPSVMME
ncbi:hypothetical protein LCGC14_1446560 [marine sediment metagenome]|uniref:Cyclic-phosphate processing Receiver domain-containing protein n=1 Tax=marine sediment metagenome TaxID=412755 RepID=A0A0F9JJT3_9ZZZZ